MYKITAPNGKIYIGQSSNIQNRWAKYLGLQCKSQTYIYDSFMEYGVENHTFEIIEECEESEAKCRERYWQDYYDVLGENGLNGSLTKCGDLKEIKHPKAIEKNRQSKIGKNTGSDNMWSQPVINTQTLKRYASATEAFTDSGLKSYDYFKSKLNGSSRNDTYFMYIKDYEKYGAVDPVYVKPHSDEAVDTYTKVEYSSVTKAGEALGIKQSVIRRYVNGQRVNNSFVVLKSDYTGKIHPPKDGKKRRIVNLDNGEVYSGCPEAARYFNTSKDVIKKILNRSEIVEGINIRFYEPDLDWSKLIKYMYKNNNSKINKF